MERDAIGGRARKRTVAWGERKRDAGEHKRSAEKNGTADCDIRGGCEQRRDSGKRRRDADAGMRAEAADHQQKKLPVTGSPAK